MSTFYGSRLQAGCVRMREIIAHVERLATEGATVRTADEWLSLDYTRPGTTLNGPSTRTVLGDLQAEVRETIEREIIRAMVREMRLEPVAGGYRLIPQRGVRR